MSIERLINNYRQECANYPTETPYIYVEADGYIGVLTASYPVVSDHCTRRYAVSSEQDLIAMLAMLEV